MKFGVIGSGSWGTALVKILLDAGQEVLWCVRSAGMVDYIRQHRRNPKYLTTVHFHADRLDLTDDPKVVYDQCNRILLAVPSSFVEGFLPPKGGFLRPGTTIISAVKGVIHHRHQLINEFLKEAVGFNPVNYVAIMGPCHAEEVAGEKLSYLTFAAEDTALATAISSCFSTPYLKIINSPDVNGVQYAGIIKNIYALGAGIADGLGYGDNFQSVFVANAAGEMRRFLQAIAPNACPSVDYSNSVYLGDLLVTCYSLFSRNRSFGHMIGKGHSVEATRLSMKMEAEGYPVSKSIAELNKESGAHMPIADAIYRIMWENAQPRAAFKTLEALLF